MIDATPPPAPEPVPEPVPESAPPPRGGVRRALWRWTRRLLALVAAVVAAALVSFFMIDLGRFPRIKQAAESRASKYLNRPMHIGAMHLLMASGTYVFDDIVIEGRRPSDIPFFTAKRITLSVPWWSLLTDAARGQATDLLVSMEMFDWRMQVETFADGHNVPQLTGPKRDPNAPKTNLPFTTTVRVSARRGHFGYDDHVTPWTVDAPNLDFDLARSLAMPQYVGIASFRGGSVKIMSYPAMASDMTLRFVLTGSRVDLTHIDLITDGSVSHVNGVVDFSKWPEQVYNVNSTVDFAKMKTIFFAKESWRLGGQGQFTGVFKLYKDGRDLTGEFASDDAAINGLRFTSLHGALQWTRDRFAVTHADGDLLGGSTRFAFSIAPLGSPTGSEERFTAEYTDVDLMAIDPLVDLRGLRLLGRATGGLELRWPTGKFGSARTGRGDALLTSPTGVTMASADLPAVPRPFAPAPAVFDPARSIRALPIAGDVHFDIDPEGLTFDDSWTTTPYTYISFSGRMASVGASEFPFHVTSHDWQESDRVLAAVMGAITKSPSELIDVGGRGTFDGTMTGTFSAPRIGGRFAGDDTRAFGVVWGHAAGELVIENKYITISQSRITRGSAADGPVIMADGRYALGFRTDDAEEIAAHVTFANWPMLDLKTSFDLDDWPVDGTIGMADLTLTGRYRDMFGAGKLRIDQGTAWSEHFDTATGDLQLEGSGMLINRVELKKATGVVRGAARIGWRDNTYAFNADGTRLPVESLDHFKFETTPLTGTLAFRANGAGSFDAPTYDFEVEVPDLFVGDEGLGALSGRATVARNILTIDRLVVASSRLDAFGSGTIALNDVSDADLRFRFQRTSLDPYLKFFAPKVSPYTRLIAGGLLVVRGPLSLPEQLLVDASIDDAQLTLFDYPLTNDGPVRLTFEDDTFTAGRLRLKGEGTSLGVAGSVDMGRKTVDLAANGDASLAILQLFFPAITSSGGATLNASYRGGFETAELRGEATIANGRLRPLSSPHSLEAINGRITFDQRGVHVDDLAGRIGNGQVDFGGTIGLNGYMLTEYALTATGRSMQLRYPEGFTSTVNTDLQLTGPYKAPMLSGVIDVIATTYRGSLQSENSLLGFAGGGPALAPPAPAPAAGAAQTTPFGLDIRVTSDRIALIHNAKVATINGTVDLQVRGTFDQPAITGTIDITDGQATIQGNRYDITPGSISFTDPNKLEPYFDVSGETRVRASGETYRINVHLNGTFDHIRPEITSDPWLPASDVYALMFGGLPQLQNAEQRALLSPQESQAQMIQTAGAILLASPLSSRVGAVFEQVLPLDTVQITPLLTGSTAFTQLNPSARITLGKRISNRVFLTYSRTYGDPAQEEIILLEYDQSDRMSWVLSRNEDRSFALDFRIRFVF